MADNWQNIGSEILDDVGGPENVARLTHCATRLRFQLKDDSAVNQEALRTVPKVITTVNSGGQYQVVIGNDVAFAYEAIAPRLSGGQGSADGREQPTGSDGETASDEGTGKKGPVARFIEMISSIFLPVIWVLSGTGLLAAILLIFTSLGLLDKNGQTYSILHAASDCVLYFLPVFLAATSAKRFKMNQYLAIAIGCALVYPSIVALASAKSVHFFGIPMAATNYTYSVLPVILAIYVASKLEHLLNKYLPSNIRNFTTPLLVVLIMVPLVLLTIGPVSNWLANGLAGGLEWLWGKAPVVGGLILGAAWQPLVVFGIHWGVWPVIINDMAVHGFSHLSAPLLPAVFAMCGATLGVFWRTKNKRTKELAGPATITGLLAGITEPAIYGVTLPLKKPFIYGVIGGSVGGAIAAAGHGGTTTFALPGGLTIPTYVGVGSFPVEMIGTAVGFALALVLTLTLGFKDAIPGETTAPGETAATSPANEPANTPAGQATAGATATSSAPAAGPGFDGFDITSPAPGRRVPLEEVPDKVFSSGALGPGFAIQPSEGVFRAPFDATVIVAPASSHAIGLRSNNGIELLIHIGLGTVELNGRHFTRRVEMGQAVHRGDVLVEADLAAIAQAGYDTTTMVVVTNAKKLPTVQVVASESADTSTPAMMVG